MSSISSVDVPSHATSAADLTSISDVDFLPGDEAYVDGIGKFVLDRTSNATVDNLTTIMPQSQYGRWIRSVQIVSSQVGEPGSASGLIVTVPAALTKTVTLASFFSAPADVGDQIVASFTYSVAGWSSAGAAYVNTYYTQV